MSRQLLKRNRYRFLPVPGSVHQQESEQVGVNQSIVEIPSKGATLCPNRITSGLLNFALFMAVTSFLVLGGAAKRLHGKPVEGTSWGESLLEASQYARALSIFVSNLT